MFLNENGVMVLIVDPFTVIPAIPIREEFSHWSKRKIRREILEAENWKLKMVSLPFFKTQLRKQYEYFEHL
jgi:hypothetical protein